MKQFLVLCVAFVAAFSAFIITDSIYSKQGWSKTHETPAEIKIGVLIPLSGKQAPMGNQMQGAFELAEEKINADGEIKVKFIFEDTKTDPKVGEIGARKLIEKEGLQIVFAFPCEVVYKVQPIADSAGALLMACNFDARSAAASALTFRMFPNLRQQTDLMLKYLGKGDGKRAAVIHLDVSAPNHAVNELLIPALKTQDWQVAAVAHYSKENPDYKAVVKQMKTANPDVILLYMDYLSIPPLLKMLKKAGLLEKTKLLGGMNFAYPFKLPAELLEGVLVVAPASTMSGRPHVGSSWFGQQFRKRHGKPPHFLAAFCFDGAMLVGNGLKASKASIEGVQAYLNSVKDYAGVTGSITFDDAGDADVKLEVGVYREGKLVPVAVEK